MIINVDKNIKAFRCGGLEVVEGVGKRIGLEEIFSSYKSKGTPLENLVKAFLSVNTTEPMSVRGTYHEIQRNETIHKKIGTKKNGLKDYYRMLETTGKHAEEIGYTIMMNVQEKFGINLETIYSDSSTVFFNGDKCEIAKYGRSSDHRPDKLQAKINVMISGKQRIPLYSSVCSGNTPDVTCFKTDLSRLNFPEGSLIVLDKGAGSKKNCDEIRANGYHYLVPKKMTAPVKNFIKEFPKEELQELFTHKSGEKVFFHEYQKDGEYLTLYYDEKRAKKDKEKRKRKIKRQKEKFNELKKIYKKTGVKGVKSHLVQEMKKVSRMNECIIKHQVTVQKRLKPVKVFIEDMEKNSYLDGMFILVSSKKIKARKKLKLYRERDIVEKLISDIKSVAKLKPFRVWNKDEVKGLVLMRTLALTMVTLVQLEFDMEGKRRETVVDVLKNLTLVQIRNKDTRKVHSFYANVDKVLGKLIGEPT